MFDSQQRIYQVVMNSEEQYSIGPEERTLPPGWSFCGFKGSKEDCLQEISRVWTDMRPKSLRDQQFSVRKLSGLV